MKNKKLLLSLLLLALISIACIFNSYAHSGRTDASGGHRDNQNQSGLGRYHYHCGGYPAHLHTNGSCPYKTPTSSTTYGGTSNYIYEDVYDEGYSDGHNEGYEEGQSEGYSEGFTVGHDEGYNKGYDEGYTKGYHDKEAEQREETTKNIWFLAIISIVIFLCYKLISHFKKERE